MQKQNIRNPKANIEVRTTSGWIFARCCAPFKDTFQFNFFFHDRMFKKTYSYGKSWCRCVSKIISSLPQGLRPLLSIPSLSSRALEALSIRSNGKTTRKGQTFSTNLGAAVVASWIATFMDLLYSCDQALINPLTWHWKVEQHSTKIFLDTNGTVCLSQTLWLPPSPPP